MNCVSSAAICAVVLSFLLPGLLMADAPAPFVLVRDYETKGEFAEPDKLGLEVSCIQAAEARTKVCIASAETPVRDRALVLRYCIPCGRPADFVHTHFPRTPVPVVYRKKDYPAQLAWGDKARGSSVLASAVPLVGVSAKGASEGLALGVEMTCFAICRLGYDAARNALYAECDLGLSPECPKTEYTFVSFPFAAEDGFRGAWERYMELHPEAFEVRLKDQGTWIAESSPSAIPNWRDFGFRIHQGFGYHGCDKGRSKANEAAFAEDDANGILSFRYTSSSNWDLAIPTNRPNDRTSARAVVAERAARGDRMAQAWEECCFHDERGEPSSVFFNEHWLRGVALNLNAEPDLPVKMTPYIAKGNSKEELDWRYSRPFPQGLDGEFVDSASGFGLQSFDYNRAHYAHMRDAPLCFDHETGRVAIYKAASTRAYIRRLADEVHARGRLMMINDCAGLYHFYAPYADVLGIETMSFDLATGAYRQKKDHIVLQYRLLAGRKPYCIFQNSNFERMTDEMFEWFMARCIAYGIFPSFFSTVQCKSKYTRFFANPEWRERVRPLYRKYFPTAKAVAEAGWEPVNRMLRSAEPDVVTVEQFGRPGRVCYVTVLNPGDAPARATLRPSHGFAAAPAYADLISGASVPVGEPFDLRPHELRVLRLDGNL